MEVNLVLLVVSNILSISALTLACIIWLPNSINMTNDDICLPNYEIPTQDYIEILKSSRNWRVVRRKLKKYIKRKNK